MCYIYVCVCVCVCTYKYIKKEINNFKTNQKL